MDLPGFLEKMHDKASIEELQLYLKQLDPGDQLQAFNFLCQFLISQGLYTEVLNISSKTISRLQVSSHDLLLVTTYINQAKALTKLFHYSDAMIALLDAEEILDRLDVQDQVHEKRFEIINIRGLIDRYRGEFDSALSTYFMGLNNPMIPQYEGIRGKLHANISTVYLIKGDLENALEHTLKALEIFMRMDNQENMAYVIHDLAYIYHLRGDLHLSYEYFQRALDMRKKLDNRENIVDTLFRFMLLLLDLEQITSAQSLLDEIQYHWELESSRLIEMKFNLAQAAILKRSERLADKALSFQLYSETAYSQVIQHELTIFALLDLTELLIYEISLTKNESLLSEITSITDTLLSIAKSQNLFVLLIQTYILKYRVALVERNLREAKEYLAVAESIARSANLSKMAVDIALEQDLLSEREASYTSITDSQQSFEERLEKSGLLDIISSPVVEQSGDELLPQEDIPIFLLILNEHALTIFSRAFDENVTINQNLIGGFLMASSFGLSEAIKGAKGTIERISYGEYTLIFEKMEDITFCYAYSGSSYSAINRLTQFTSHIWEHKEIWGLIHQPIIQPRQINHQVEPIISQVFSDTS